MTIASPVRAESLSQSVRQQTTDCDVHHIMADSDGLFPYLPRQYREQVEDFGRMAPGVGYTNVSSKGTFNYGTLHNLDTEENSDEYPTVVVDHHIENYDLDLVVLSGGPYAYVGPPSLDLGTAVCRAFNDWTADQWLPADRRLRGSVHIAPNDPVQAAAEIRRLGSDTRFVQALMPAGAHFQFGHRMYHPIYQAGVEVGLPMCIHFEVEGAGTAGAPTAAGFPTYNLEMRMARPQIALAHTASLICEGVLEKFPDFKVLFIEHDVF